MTIELAIERPSVTGAGRRPFRWRARRDVLQALPFFHVQTKADRVTMHTLCEMHSYRPLARHFLKLQARALVCFSSFSRSFKHYTEPEMGRRVVKLLYRYQRQLIQLTHFLHHLRLQILPPLRRSSDGASSSATCGPHRTHP